MKKERIFKTVFAVIGIVIGLNLARLVISNQLFAFVSESTKIWLDIGTYVLLGLGFGAFGLLATPLLVRFFSYVTKMIVRYFSSLSMGKLFLGIIGLIVGLVIALLISALTLKIEPRIFGTILSIFIYLVCGYVGWIIPTKRIKEINIPKWFKRNDAGMGKALALPKILDTSAIIDGRFFDVYKTGIIEGTVIVPGFVLKELQQVADSTDPVKHSKGRRGLEILDSMKESESIVLLEKDYNDVSDVDEKVLRLATDIKGMIVTTDYNLNKLANVQHLHVFNINDLANSLKLIVATGQELIVSIVKEGKEFTQGVGYFEDGTMIVVEGARKFVGENVAVVVTSVLQTSAGRMVFAKIKD